MSARQREIGAVRGSTAVIREIFDVIDLADSEENRDLFIKICEFYDELPEEQTSLSTSFFDHIVRLSSDGRGKNAGFPFNSENKAKIRKIFKEAFADNSGDQLKAELLVSGGNCSSPVIRFLQSYDLRERDKPGVALAKFLKKEFDQIYKNNQPKYYNLMDDKEQIEILNTVINMIFAYDRLFDDSPMLISSKATLYSAIGEFPFEKLIKVSGDEFTEALKEMGLLNENKTWNMDKIAEIVASYESSSNFKDRNLVSKIIPELMDDVYEISKDHIWSSSNKADPQLALIQKLRWDLESVHRSTTIKNYKFLEKEANAISKLQEETEKTGQTEKETEKIKKLKNKLSRAEEKADGARKYFKEIDDKIVEYISSKMGKNFTCSTENLKLLNACSAGQVDVVKEILNSGKNGSLPDGLNLNIENILGEKALQIALENESSEIVELLVDNGADISGCEEKLKIHEQNYPGIKFMKAVIEGDLETVKSIHKSVGHINFVNKEGETPLHLLPKNRLNLLQYLVENGADVNQADKEGETPLMSAARDSDTMKFKYLLENGANINQANKEKKTVFDLAIMGRPSDSGVLSCLLESGLGDDLLLFGINDIPFLNGKFEKLVEFVEELLELSDKRKIKINLTSSLECALKELSRFRKEKESQEFAWLDNGMIKKAQQICDILVGRPEIDLNEIALIIKQSDELESDLLNEIIKPKFEYLLRYETDLKNNDQKAFELLSLAVLLEDDYIAKEILTDSSLADKNKARQDQFGNTLLILAANAGHLDTVTTLLGKGYNVNESNEKKYTALHEAAKKGHLDVVKALVDAGAEIDLSTVALAVKNGHFGVSTYVSSKLIAKQLQQRDPAPNGAFAFENLSDQLNIEKMADKVTDPVLQDPLLQDPYPLKKWNTTSSDISKSSDKSN